ncbi:class I mannose-6-phosphate isomerase [Novosphingobium sp. G106]|uniref:class I mannose-6-phosphate isomerase n=1 Tax=Novosphingobium sp. G106 TaxID=2849500 RepID=UPI001C2CD673|nr:class I mannose-6-phosphate isomerase [Novosphingobium sp. G106]MBV1688699.1 class I mannose-6-phosphate isomerase [Novosphingobium sp. G106]
MSAVLPIREVEKPWGRDALPAPFTAREGKRIGEIWFEPPPALPQLLVKYIFTSEALSVQVHPSDAETLAKGLGRQGKEECWLIVSAEPDAKLGIGFRDKYDADMLRKAALDGSIEQLMQWHAVRPGDFFYIPAGTVHAIGAGVGLIEVQQNSDITYRLYDYGRPRELHLDEGMAVAKGEPYQDQYHMHVPDRDDVTLVEGPLFRLDQIEGLPNEDVALRYGAGSFLVIPTRGEARIGSEAIRPGSGGLAARFDDVAFDENGACLIAQPVGA